MNMCKVNIPHNYKELEMSYQLLRLAEDAGNKDAVLFLKREIRKFTHKPVNESVMLKDYGIDGGLVLVQLPEGIQSEAEALDYFLEVEAVHPSPCAFDCTGQLFTAWYKIIERQGRYWAYHRVCLDC